MPDAGPDRPSVGGRQILHRSLDIQEHAELVPNASGIATNETYQDANGQHLWTLKRFPGAPSSEPSTNNNPEEVEQVRK